jgi:hypothetical protein
MYAQDCVDAAQKGALAQRVALAGDEIGVRVRMQGSTRFQYATRNRPILYR